MCEIVKEQTQVCTWKNDSSNSFHSAESLLEYLGDGNNECPKALGKVNSCKIILFSHTGKGRW